MTPDSTRKTLTKAHLIERLEHAEAELAQERQLTAALLTMLVAVSKCAGSVPLSVTDDRYLESIRADKVLSTIKVMCRDDAAFVPRPQYIANYVRRLNEVADEPIKYRRWVPSEPSEPVAVIPAPPAPATAAAVIQPDSRDRIELPGGHTQTCDCPNRNGTVYHQRATCTDPLVSKLNWFADDTNGWISGSMGERDGDNGRPDGSEYQREPGCICDANYGECPLHVDVSKPIEGDPVPCKDPQCGHIAADHAITDFSNLAARFPCTRCGCTNFTISSAKVRR